MGRGLATYVAEMILGVEMCMYTYRLHQRNRGITGSVAEVTTNWKISTLIFET